MNSNACGPFRITKPYWAGAGSPTLLDESPQSVSAFTHCTQLGGKDCEKKLPDDFVSPYQKCRRILLKYEIVAQNNINFN